MKDLLRVWDSTLLSSRKTYHIEGTLYRYLYTKGTIQHPQYIFCPLEGQRKKADITLNHQKLLTRCYEVPDMVPGSEVVSSNAVQLSLF
ncbi:MULTISPECIES: hypothetical protein [unclassified Tolypothrix]|nr:MULTISPECIES: hypothetical protein [unclassified Tolypothrix]BAY95875.1 hypothetical protein NIES3275_79520 [Microchaete diplosiphon NIES-3275]EKE96783.1 hypothetical protein FDUTEX481_06325 [Tolypothrix sp. PCC 7601]MBE9083923.1 hypothetical protein [Tolypothrix sp. LEGE 11397]UYD30988.1 hypothetical protein HGR01_39615 [Tolypothrix sp. PCC 7712]UYD38839.1 hypothetical protein HG267_40850 [Tolypothrix sp. PCC 7601]